MANTAWQSWIYDTSAFGNQTTGGTSMSAQVWMNWTATAATTTGYMSVPVYQSSPAPVLTPEQRAEREREAQRKREFADERARQLAAANKRAAALLQAVLDDEQKEELEKQGYFHVHTRNGKRVYRLRPGYNPVRIKGEDGKQYSYCIHPRTTFPNDDAVAALKLLLDSDEGAFLKIANRSLTQVAA